MKRMGECEVVVVKIMVRNDDERRRRMEWIDEFSKGNLGGNCGGFGGDF